MRDNTGRPETIEVGANMLTGADPRKIPMSARSMMGCRAPWDNPFWDGTAAARILDALEKEAGRFGR